MKTEIKVEGLEELQRRFTDPALLHDPLQALLKEAETMGRRQAESAIDGGTGIAVRSIGGEVMETSARIYSAMPRARAVSIEKGRPPGESMSSLVPQLTRWGKSVGHPLPGREIAQEVQATGTRGKRFLRAAKDMIKQNMPGMVAKMARNIEAKWGRG